MREKTAPNAQILELLSGLPGESQIRSGLADLAAGRETIESLLVLIGSPRLKECGIAIPETTADILNADYRLYDILQVQHGNDAHSQHNALIRQLVSFERALEHRVSRAERLAAA
jgi:hypothetical protein